MKRNERMKGRREWGGEFWRIGNGKKKTIEWVDEGYGEGERS